jgi:hypothetical protein
MAFRLAIVSFGFLRDSVIMLPCRTDGVVGRAKQALQRRSAVDGRQWTRMGRRPACATAALTAAPREAPRRRGMHRFFACIGARPPLVRVTASCAAARRTGTRQKPLLLVQGGVRLRHDAVSQRRAGGTNRSSGASHAPAPGVRL